jgi:hypothetical protein
LRSNALMFDRCIAFSCFVLKDAEHPQNDGAATTIYASTGTLRAVLFVRNVGSAVQVVVEQCHQQALLHLLSGRVYFQQFQS